MVRAYTMISVWVKTSEVYGTHELHTRLVLIILLDLIVVPFLGVVRCGPIVGQAHWTCWTTVKVGIRLSC